MAPTTGSRYVAGSVTQHGRSVCGPRSKAAKSLAVARYAARVRTIGRLRTSEIAGLTSDSMLHRKSAGYELDKAQRCYLHR